MTEQVARAEIARRLKVYDDLCEFVATYEWADADGGEAVVELVREILGRGTGESEQ